MANILKTVLRWSLITTALTVAMMLLALIAVQTNTVKEWMTDQVLVYLSSRTKHKVEISEVKINWFDEISVKNAKILDLHDSVMFSSEEVAVNYALFELISKTKIKVEGVSLQNSFLNLRKYSDSSAINLLSFLSALGGESSKEQRPGISLNMLQALNWRVSYKDFRYDSTELDLKRFNPGWFNFNVDNINAQDLWLANDSLEFNLIDFKGNEYYSGLPVERFQSHIGLYPRAMIFDDMSLSTGRSLITDSLALSYNKPANLTYFRDSVVLFLRLKDSRIALADIGFFGNFPKHDEGFKLSGEIIGKLSNIDFRSFFISSIDGSNVELDASLIGLPRISETFMDIKIKSSFLRSDRIKEYLKQDFVRHGDIRFNGSLVGFINDFVAYGSIGTLYGKINTDLNFKRMVPFDYSSYRGTISLRNFNLGSILSLKSIGKLNFQGSISGSGLTRETASFLLNAKAQNINYEGYSYDSVSVLGDFKANFFQGQIRVADQRGSIDGRATIDFSQPTEIINLDLEIDSIDLFSIGLTNRPSWFSSQLTADLRDINVNQTEGQLKLKKTSINSQTKELKLDSINLDIEIDSINHYSLKSDLIDLNLKGEFNLTDLVRDFPINLRSFLSYFKLGEPYEIKINKEVEYSTKLDVNFKKLNPLFTLLELPIWISERAHLEIRYNHKNDIAFGIYARLDTLKFKDRIFYDNELLLDASRDEDSPNILALVQISSQDQSWNDKINTEQMELEAIWSKNSIISNFKIQQRENRSRANIKSVIHLKKDTIDFKLLPSDLIVFDNQWSISPKNNVQIFKNKYQVESFELYNGTQHLLVDGVVSDTLLTKIDFQFENFDLRNLSSLSPRQFGGVVDSKGTISRPNNQVPLRFETDINANDLTFEEILIGNLTGYSEWNRQENGLYIDYSIQRENLNTIELYGFFKPFDESQLDVQLSFEQANLKLLEPLFETLITDLEGAATGELSLTGRLNRPKMRGISTINDGQVKIDYLNTIYDFSGVTRFFEQQIAFDNIEVKDRFNHLANLNGAINHDQFRDVFLNVDFNFEQFELLNTNRQHNSLYYGNANATGRVQLIGPVENILIQADGTTSSNTKIFIPLIEEASAEQSNFITFKSKNDTLSVEDESLNLEGINIDFDMTITPDAYIELIFNPLTGDIIRGRGNGNLQLTVNSSGDFDLFGNYTVQEGAYNFTTSVFNKEFEVLPEGTIDWFGDPYGGNMNITATYRQLADISDLEAQTNPQISTQKRPVLVVLDMDGPMMSPEIKYHLELDDQSTANLDPNWSQKISSLNSDEAELKRQVFSLLVLRKFSERNAFVVSGQNTLTTGLTNSMGEFISNQLSYWLNQWDENLEIDIDLNSLSSEAFNNFQLRLAYSFLDGRLRVTRGGGVTTIVDENDESDLQNILGDWSVEYILTENGKLRVRFFSRSSQYSIQQGQETGLSLQYVTSYDEFKDILRKSRNNSQLSTDPSNDSE
jgi:hypothetical protein